MGSVVTLGHCLFILLAAPSNHEGQLGRIVQGRQTMPTHISDDDMPLSPLIGRSCLLSEPDWSLKLMLVPLLHVFYPLSSRCLDM